jgi:hypothetical protein
MRVAAEHLAETLFDLYLAHDRNVYSSELHDRIAAIELVGEDEDEVVAALVRLSEMIGSEQRRRH